MSSVEVRPVRSRRDRHQFMEFPWRLYEQDPHWIPPLRRNQAELLGWHRHPFYLHAEGQCFLASVGGEVRGRIMAICDREHQRVYKDERGSFGFFESVDDAEVAVALLEAVRKWCRERGLTALRGPLNPSMNYECGLLIEGFDSPPTFMMTYNPPYYARLLEAGGLRKAHDLVSYEGHVDQLPQVTARLGPLADQALERSGATIRCMNNSQFRAEVELFLRLYNGSMQGHWGFVPLTMAEIRTLAGSMKHLIVPELAFVTMAAGRPVGAVFALPDYNPTIKAIDGRLLPFGFLRLLKAKRHLARIRVISINVLPEYQRWGLGLALMKALVPKALELGVQTAEFSWILESNDMARMGLVKGGARLAKTYRLYDGDVAS